MGKRGEKLVNVGKSGESGSKWGKSSEKWEQETCRPDSSAI